MTRHDIQMDEMPTRSSLLDGEIMFEEGSPSFARATVHIFIEDTTLADAPARMVVHHVIENVSADMVRNERLTFALDGNISDTRALYTVRVLVDLDGDARISHGDYASVASYPVLTRGYPSRVVIYVRRVS
jgi:hypothetical protein